jgi:hypothetical protein
MTSPDDDFVARLPNTGVFLARAWREDDGAFRARITYHLNINCESDPGTQTVTDDPNQIHLLLATWLTTAADADRAQPRRTHAVEHPQDTQEPGSDVQ